MLLHIAGQTIDPQTLLSTRRTLISVGRQSADAYNVITIDDASVDLFQCQLKQTADGWLLQNGQWRTECPKGIISRLQHACSMCMGRCVNSRPANPTYSWRIPANPTLLNSQPLPDEGTVLTNGDIILCGNINIQVAEGA